MTEGIRDTGQDRSGSAVPFSLLLVLRISTGKTPHSTRVIRL